MLAAAPTRVFAKIAGELDAALARRRRSGSPGSAVGTSLARGDGWDVDDVICTSGPADRPFEERHTRVSIAIVVAGTFQYRAGSGSALMTPGSMLLGTLGQCFTCGHEHASGDRCVAFNFAPEFFDGVAADAGAGDATSGFSIPRLPPLRESADVVSRASAALLAAPGAVAWEEIAVRVAADAAGLASRRVPAPRPPHAKAVARVTDVVRAIERLSVADASLDALAQRTGLSPYHFLRTFEYVTGLTPHRYVRRAQLREAATRLATEESRVIDVVYDSGFGDVANFNRAFRAEFGVTPREWRSPRVRA
jgi:AraC-like DNA-binding protein